LDELFQSRRKGTAEQLSQNRDVAGRMDVLSIDPHLDPDPDSLQLHPVTVGGPLDPADPSEPAGDFMDSPLESVASLFQGLAVREGQVDPRHWFLQHKLCWTAASIHRGQSREDDLGETTVTAVTLRERGRP
jgi:hypothetical protein